MENRVSLWNRNFVDFEKGRLVEPSRRDLAGPKFPCRLSLDDWNTWTWLCYTGYLTTNLDNEFWNWKLPNPIDSTSRAYLGDLGYLIQWYFIGRWNISVTQRPSKHVQLFTKIRDIYQRFLIRRKLEYHDRVYPIRHLKRTHCVLGPVLVLQSLPSKIYSTIPIPFFIHTFLQQK